MAIARLKPFDVKSLQNIKPTDKKRYIREGRGFTLQVLPSGVKTFLYIYTFNGKRKHLNLGDHAHVKLKDAREQYNLAYNQVKGGIDPQEYNKSIAEAKEKAEDTSFGWFADKYLIQQEEEGLSINHRSVMRYALNKDLLPEWKDRPINTIRRKDVIALLEKVGARAKGTVKNVQSAASGVFDYALQREYIEGNPALNLSKPLAKYKSVPRERHLTDSQVKEVWYAIDKGLGNAETKRALKLILVTAQRPGEVAGMHSQEIQVGVDNPRCATCRGCGGWWTIPKERSKNGNAHKVYLTPTALGLIGDVKGYIFPSPRENRPIARNSISQMVSQRRRPENSTNKEHAPYYGLPRWTPHDLRRTARTYMAKLGVTEEHAEAVLNHAKQGMVKTYNQYPYQEEIKSTLLRWEAELMKLVR